MEYKAAVDALTKFKAAAKKRGDRDKGLATEESNDEFVLAMQKFHNTVKAFSGVQGVDQQIAKLPAAGKAVTA